jgi:hypothetical protein
MASRIGPVSRRIAISLADLEDRGRDLGRTAVLEDRLLQVLDPLADPVERREEGVDQLVEHHVEQKSRTGPQHLRVSADPAGGLLAVDRLAAVDGDQPAASGEDVELVKLGDAHPFGELGAVRDHQQVLAVLLELWALVAGGALVEGRDLERELLGDLGQLGRAGRGHVDPDHGAFLGPHLGEAVEVDVARFPTLAEHVDPDHGLLLDSWTPERLGSLEGFVGAAGQARLPAQLRDQHAGEDAACAGPSSRR